MSVEELKMEHEHLHYLVEKIQAKAYIDQKDDLELKRLKKEKVYIKTQMISV